VGVFRFERVPEQKGGKNVLEFDSSHDRAIARAFGYAEGSVEIRETERDGDRRIIYDVFARDYGEGKPLTKRGRLLTLTPLEIRRRQDANLSMSPRH
jgi:hypothetical protein